MVEVGVEVVIVVVVVVVVVGWGGSPSLLWISASP